MLNIEIYWSTMLLTTMLYELCESERGDSFSTYRGCYCFRYVIVTSVLTMMSFRTVDTLKVAGNIEISHIWQGKMHLYFLIQAYFNHLIMITKSGRGPDHDNKIK